MANDFFNATGNPSTSSAGSSVVMRTEFSSIGSGFDKMPTLTGNGSKLVRVNSGGTGLEAVAVGTAVDIAALTTAATSKATPVDADELPITDSAASFGLKKLTWANLKATLATTFAALAGSVSQAFSASQLEVGHATDTTITRSSAGVIAVEGEVVATNSTSRTHTAQTIELGHATDTTLTRVSAGVMAVEGKTVAVLSSKQTFTAQQTPMNGTLTDGATIDWNGDSNGQVVAVTLGGNRTMNAPTNIVQYTMYTMRIAQDGTGSRTLSWNAAFKFGTAGAPTLTTTASKVDVLMFIGGSSNTMEYIGCRLDAV